MSSNDLVKLCRGVNAYLDNAEENNFSTKETVRGLPGCLLAISEVIISDFESDSDINHVRNVMYKLSVVLEDSVTPQQPVDLPVVSQQPNAQFVAPDLSVAKVDGSGLDGDDDWNDYGSMINTPGDFSKSFSGLNPVKPESSPSSSSSE